MYILLHVRDVVVVVWEFVRVGLRGRAGWRAPGTLWLRFGLGTVVINFVSPHKGLPRCGCDDGCMQGSVAPLMW